MKKHTHILFSLVLLFTSIAAQAAGQYDLTRSVVSKPVISKTIKQADDYGGMCDCSCTNGTWVCNVPSCGLHGSSCDAGGTSAIQRLNSTTVTAPQTLPNIQTQPKVLPGDHFNKLPRF